jgi:hypothetical protein
MPAGYSIFELSFCFGVFMPKVRSDGDADAITFKFDHQSLDHRGTGLDDSGLLPTMGRTL